MRMLAGLLVLCWLLGCSPNGWADPFAADGFEAYAPGSVNGGAGGSGFGAAWEGRGGSIEAVVDTSADPLVFSTPGGETVAGDDRALAFSGNNDLAAVRDLLGRHDDPDVYVSMLIRFDGTQNDNDFLALWFENAGFGAAPNIGIKMNDGTGASASDFFVRTQSNNHVSRVDLVPGQTYFLVGHLSKSTPAGVYDRFRLWVDPATLSVEPADDGVSQGNSNIASFDRIGFRIANLDSNDRVVVDRLRVGTSWLDVASPDVHPVLELRMDDTRWNGTAGEVTDGASGFGGTGFNGATTADTDPALSGAVGTCRYGTFDGANDYVLVPHHGELNGTDALTYMAWIHPDRWGGIRQVVAKSVHGGGSGRAQMGVFSENSQFKARAETIAGRREVGVSLPALGTWTHVAAVFSGDRLEIYLDGVLAASTSFARTQLVQTSDDLAVSKRIGTSAYYFDGAIDEVRVYTQALTASDVAAAMNQTRPCDAVPFGVASGFRIAHDGAGIHCLDEPVTVTAVDTGGGVVAGYSDRVDLDTGTGRGSWSVQTGAGTLVDGAADDGLATYTFDPADGGSATFLLSYPQGPQAVDVDVYQSNDPTVRDDDAEGTLTFAPSGFTVTASALPNPPPSPLADPIDTQVAATGFPLHITAYGVTDDDPQCGIIESYSGSHDLTFAMSHVNPGSGSVLATVNGQAVNSGAAQSVTFNAGQAQVSARYKDVGSIHVSVTDSSSFPNTLNGASNDFVVQPAALVISRIQSVGGAGNPGATSATGPAFVAAGEAFGMDVEARDSEGDVTPNFGRESPAEGVQVTLSSLTVPAAGVGSVVNGTAFSASGVPGRFTDTSLAFDDVGVITLRPELADGDYLGTGAVPGALSGPVGRFHPASFDLASSAVAPGCGTFTYMDQPALSLQYHLRALNRSGNITRNYDTGLLGAPAVATVTHVAEASDDGVDLGARLSAVGGAWVAGEVVVNRPDLTFVRAAAPDGPYDPLQLAVKVTDSLDGVALQGLDTNADASGDCVVAGNCSARSLGAATRVVYGRLAVLPISGPENEDLKLPLAAQMFTGAAFEQNPADTCSAYTSAELSLAAYSGNLAPGETSVIAPLGTATLSGGAADSSNPPALSAPGFGNDGSVDVTLDVDSWLEFDWLGSGATNPVATASFGHFRGHDRIIYWGEPR